MFLIARERHPVGHRLIEIGGVLIAIGGDLVAIGGIAIDVGQRLIEVCLAPLSVRPGLIQVRQRLRAVVFAVVHIDPRGCSNLESRVALLAREPRPTPRRRPPARSVLRP